MFSVYLAVIVHLWQAAAASKTSAMSYWRACYQLYLRYLHTFHIGGLVCITLAQRLLKLYHSLDYRNSAEE